MTKTAKLIETDNLIVRCTGRAWLLQEGLGNSVSQQLCKWKFQSLQDKPAVHFQKASITNLTGVLGILTMMCMRSKWHPSFKLLITLKMLLNNAWKCNCIKSCLDPYACCFLQSLEDDHPAVCAANKNSRFLADGKRLQDLEKCHAFSQWFLTGRPSVSI